MDLTPEQFATLRQLFDNAVDLSQSERETLIEGVRRDHGDELADELVRRLEAYDESTDTVDEPQGPRPIAEEPASAFREGEVILNRFRIVRVLGRGGMGDVFEAQDQELGPVALKTIRRDLIGDRSVLRRLKQEVQLARQVTSPYVCRIHELFMLPENGEHRVAAFLTMELIDGITLAKRIEQSPLPWSEAEPIAIEICQGLEAVHRAGLVHRDLKPSNTMLAKRGNLTQAVVMDLGLALRPEASLQSGAKLTRTGRIVGTPGYMAPEQFEGGMVSAATDVYALGLVLYEMTTGKRPFEASTPLAAAVRRAKRPPSVSSIQPGLPRRLDRVIDKCLEFEPADRFPSAEAVAKALKGERTISWGSLLLGGSRRQGRPPSRRALFYGGGAAIALAATTTFWFWPTPKMSWHPLPERRFVATMMWPKLTDPQQVSLARELLATISRELARAEASDRKFLILASGTGSDYPASTPAEAAGILGANLVLAASVLPASGGFRAALAVLDPVNTSSPLRQDIVSGSASTLPQRAAEAAAKLLDVHLGKDAPSGRDESSNVPEANQLFLNAQEQMNLPNNEGLDSAIEKYQAAIRKDPRFAAAYAGLAIAYGRRHAFQGGQPDLALASRNSKLAMEYGPASSRAKFSQALVKLYSGDTEDAVRMFADLLRADPGNEDVLMYEARAFHDMNRADMEKQVYLNLLSQRPNYWPAYNDLGLIYRDKPDYREAIKYFLLAKSIAPRATIPWTNLGAVYLLVGQFDDARDACQRSIANHPNEDALALLGDIAFLTRDYRKALDYYQRARDMNPNQHTFWRDIGDAYSMLRDPSQAQKNYRKAWDILRSDLEINPRSGEDWMSLAYYSTKLGNQVQARKQLAEAEERGAADIESQLQKAQILVLFGQKEEGIQLALDLLRRGLSPVYVNLSLDLQSVLGDPRLRAALGKPR